jgi:hypothetical protein
MRALHLKCPAHDPDSHPIPYLTFKRHGFSSANNAAHQFNAADLEHSQCAKAGIIAREGDWFTIPSPLRLILFW